MYMCHHLFKVEYDGSPVSFTRRYSCSNRQNYRGGAMYSFIQYVMVLLFDSKTYQSFLQALQCLGGECTTNPRQVASLGETHCGVQQ